MDKKLKVQIGDIGHKSRVSFGGDNVPGVTDVKVIVSVDEMSKVVITVYARDCEIVQENV